MSGIKDFLIRNKAPIGGLFLALWGWSAVEGCVPYFGINIVGYCESIQDVLGMLGAFLTGAGIIPSDYRSKVVQGKIIPSK